MGKRARHYEYGLIMIRPQHPQHGGPDRVRFVDDKLPSLIEPGQYHGHGRSQQQAQQDEQPVAQASDVLVMMTVFGYLGAFGGQCPWYVTCIFLSLSTP